VIKPARIFLIRVFMLLPLTWTIDSVAVRALIRILEVARGCGYDQLMRDTNDHFGR
jgi:hypothetical protein